MTTMSENSPCKAILSTHKRCAQPKFSTRFCKRHTNPSTANYEKSVATLEKYNLKLVHGRLDYVNAFTPIDIICGEGHVTRDRSIFSMCSISKARAVSNVRCPQCRASDNQSELGRVKEKLEVFGHELISSEKNPRGHYKITYICGCRLDNNERIEGTTDSHTILRDEWGGCIKCLNWRTGALKSLDDVFDEFFEHGCILLADAYTGNKTKMPFVCSCGEEGMISYHEFDQGQRCGKCRTARYRETMQREYGVDNSFQIPEVKEKIRQTHLEKRGVEYPTQSKEVIEKRDETVANAYGAKYTFHTEESISKSNETMNDKYNTGCFMSSNAGKEFSRDTYRCDNVMQNAEVFEKQRKSQYTIKEYKLPSGILIMLQGWEHRALDEILKYTDENDIVVETSHMPRIYYTIDGDKQHRYYPDIYIKSKRLVIEVKSLETLSRDMIKNRRKFQYTNMPPVRMEIWVYRTEKDENPLIISDDKQFDDLCNFPELDTMNQALLEQNAMMMDEYVDTISLFVRKMSEDKKDTEPEQKRPAMTLYRFIDNTSDLATVYEKVLKGELERDEIKRFSAKQIEELAKNVNIDLGSSHCKDEMIDRLLQPARYNIDKLKGLAGQPLEPTGRTRAIKHLEALGHTYIKYRCPKIYYRCKHCNEERSTEPKCITSDWQMCKSCYVSIGNTIQNAVRNKLRIGIKYKPREKETKEISIKKTQYQIAMDKISKIGHTNISYESPFIIFTCKNCNKVKKTKAEYISDQWHTCRDCSILERAKNQKMAKIA